MTWLDQRYKKWLQFKLLTTLGWFVVNVQITLSLSPGYIDYQCLGFFRVVCGF